MLDINLLGYPRFMREPESLRPRARACDSYLSLSPATGRSSKPISGSPYTGAVKLEESAAHKKREKDKKRNNSFQ